MSYSPAPRWAFCIRPLSATVPPNQRGNDMKLIVGAVALMALAGCLDQGKVPEGLVQATKEAKELSIANNSPDLTVKSWWAAKDAAMRLDSQICFEYVRFQAPASEKLYKLATSDIPIDRPCDGGVFIFDRVITRVEIQSDTRAVVKATIKNATPPEAGAVLDDSDIKAKAEGEPYLYTLERKDADSGWAISRIDRFPSYARDWEKAYDKPQPSSNRFVYEQYQ